MIKLLYCQDYFNEFPVLLDRAKQFEERWDDAHPIFWPFLRILLNTRYWWDLHPLVCILKSFDNWVRYVLKISNFLITGSGEEYFVAADERSSSVGRIHTSEQRSEIRSIAVVHIFIDEVRESRQGWSHFHLRLTPSEYLFESATTFRKNEGTRAPNPSNDSSVTTFGRSSKLSSMCSVFLEASSSMRLNTLHE